MYALFQENGFIPESKNEKINVNYETQKNIQAMII